MLTYQMSSYLDFCMSSISHLQQGDSDERHKVKLGLNPTCSNYELQIKADCMFCIMFS